MAPIKFSRVISVSSEDPRYPAKNLLNSDVAGPWKCKEAGEPQAAIILQFDESCVIQSIDIGNANSAFVEIFVGKSVTPDEFEILRVASVLMSVKDAKNDQNKNVVRFFKHDEFNKPAADKSWDRLKIICKQPFNKHVQYGLAFVKVHARSENTQVKKEDSIFGKFALKKEDNDDELFSVGSFFAKRKDTSEPVSAASAIRQASNDPGGSIFGKMSTTTKRLSDALPNKDVKKIRKNGDIDDRNSDGCRRSITGPLLYLQDDAEEDKADVSKTPTNDKNPKKQNDTQSKKNSDNAKNRKTDSPSTQTKRTIDSPSSSRTKKDTPSTPTAKPKTDDSSKQKTPKNDPPRKRANSDDQSNSQKKVKTDVIKNLKRKPFNKLLEGAVFVISGYQNPFRGELRSKALKMGAKYKADWDDSCTHLICAFTNTPKYNQVLGEGWIVRKDWIEDCHSQRKRLSCVGYKLDKNDPYTHSNDEEIWEGDEKAQKAEKIAKEKEKVNVRPSFDGSSSKENTVTGSQEAATSRGDIYDAETDIDSEHEDPQIENRYENLSLKVLPALFDNKKFYLGTDLLQSTANLLRRYIIAYKGEPHDDVDDVNYIISEDNRYKDNVTETPVVLPDWIWECNDRKTLVPVDDYLL